MKNKRNYVIIFIYGLLVTFLLLGINNVYGSTVDWHTQHSVLPNYFRNLFYDTKTLLPNLAFNLGAGQNIFQFSYYGLMSPIILLSYFLPFIDMSIYIMVMSFILYVSSGMLLYKFLEKHTSSKESLILSILFLSLSPLTYHFHYHLMFVWYFPFLILAFIGVDRYIEKQKSFLLMLSIFFLLLTNYYYGVTSILVIVIYGIYSLLDKYTNVKTFIISLLKASLRIIIPVFLACFLLLPSLYTVMQTGRSDINEITLSSLFLFNIKEGMYGSFTTGISSLFIISLLSIFATKKKTKKEIFLNIVLLLITFIPLFMYILNGFLYVRGKVLIPFIILYIISIVNFIKRIKAREINFKNLLILVTITFLYICLTNYQNTYFKLFTTDLIITLVFLCFSYKYQKMFFLIPTLLIVLCTSFINNENAKYLSKKEYKNIQMKDATIEQLFQNIDDDSFYRTDANIREYINMNKVYGENYYSTSLYTSSYNNLYHTFYNDEIGNNLVHRNILMTSGTYNPLFNEMMGIKYLITKANAPLGYEKKDEIDGYKLYQNDNVLPIIYVKENYGSIKEYEDLSFPYNTEYMLKYGVTTSDQKINYTSNIKKLDLDLQKEYQFTLSKKEKFTYHFDEPLKDVYLLIKFRMNYNQSCSLGDVSITINQVANKLTCKQWRYHNQNNSFEYVISSNDEITSLQIELTKGKYDITDMEIYIMPKITYEYQKIDNLNIDKKRSTITGHIDASNDAYVITSLPYDDGYSIYIDEEKIDKEIVNTTFLGFKVSKGSHTIKIVYHSPWFIYGLILSFAGLMGFIFILLIEREKIRTLLLKYMEIISYLIFGFLNTIVNLVIYYGLTKTCLNPQNSIELQCANIISWIISVAFAYITNKHFVFHSKNKGLKEIISFFAARVLTLIVDMLIMFVFVSLLHFDDDFIKIISQVIVIVLNYIISKLIVFKEVKNG